MNQRGSVGLYLIFSIVVSVAAGYGVYRVMKENPGMFESKRDDSATQEAKAPTVTKKTPTPPAPTPAPIPEEVQEEPALAATIASERAVDPIVDADSDASPIFGTPGIVGEIDRGAVERRFKPRAAILQRCYERNGEENTGALRVTMEIDETGKLTRVLLSEGWSDGFLACMYSAINFSFSPPRDGKPAVVVQPIAFR